MNEKGMAGGAMKCDETVGRRDNAATRSQSFKRRPDGRRGDPRKMIGMTGNRVARETGLEPATSGVTGRRSNQLSYSPMVPERGPARPA